MTQKPPPPSEPDGDLLIVGGPTRDVRVSLRLLGDDLVPEEITGALGAEPTQAWRRGDVKPDSRYHKLYGGGGWLLESSLSRAVALDQHIVELLAHLNDDLEVWRSLADCFYVDLRCGLFLQLFNEEATLSASVLSLLSERHIQLSLDIYGAEPDPELLERARGKA